MVEKLIRSFSVLSVVSARDSLDSIAMMGSHGRAYLIVDALYRRGMYALLKGSIDRIAGMQLPHDIMSLPID